MEQTTLERAAEIAKESLVKMEAPAKAKAAEAESKAAAEKQKTLQVEKEKVATDVSPRFGYRRRALNEHHILFEELLAAENLVISWDEFYYFAHWITPPGAPRRYDTRFFLAVAPSAQSPTHDTHEMIECTWKSPRELLQAFEEKSIFMMRPTVRSIYALSQFASLHALLEALGPIAPGLVDMVDDGGGLRRRFIGESDEEAARGPHPAPRFSAKPMP
jgi:hypothetical protein